MAERTNFDDHDDDAQFVNDMRRWFDARERAEQSLRSEHLEKILAPVPKPDSDEIERLRRQTPREVERRSWWSECIARVSQPGWGGMIPVAVGSALAVILALSFLPDDRGDEVRFAAIDTTWEMELPRARSIAGPEPAPKCVPIGPEPFTLPLRPHEKPPGHYEATMFAESGNTRVHLFHGRTFQATAGVFEIDIDADTDLPLRPGQWTLVAMIGEAGNECDPDPTGEKRKDCVRVDGCVEILTDEERRAMLHDG